jgi:hypothetical protein
VVLWNCVVKQGNHASDSYKCNTLVLFYLVCLCVTLTLEVSCKLAQPVSCNYPYSISHIYSVSLPAVVHTKIIHYLNYPVTSKC